MLSLTEMDTLILSYLSPA